MGVFNCFALFILCICPYAIGQNSDTGSALKCYECIASELAANTDMTTACLDPFDPEGSEVPLITCPQEEGLTPQCFKSMNRIYDVKGRKEWALISRGCASYNMDSGCSALEEAAGSGQSVQCYCGEDACNGANSLPINILSASLPLVFAAYVHSRI